MSKLFTANRDSFLGALSAVMGVVDKKKSMPVLSNVLIEIGSDGLKFTATDLEVQLISKTNQDIKTDNEMSITLPGKKLIDICKNLPKDSDLKFSINKDRVTIKSGRSKFTLATLPGSDFPVVGCVDGSTTFTVNQGALRDQVSSIQFAMAQQDVRYYLNGMLFELKGGQLVTVATDGHRLALSEQSVDHKNDVQVILPRKGVVELSRLLNESGDAIISIAQNHIQVDLGEIQFTSKLIDGKYPEYARVIPESSANNISINREKLKQSLQRASVLSNEKFRGINLDISENIIGINCHNPEQEEAEDYMDIEYFGDSFKVGFNVSYLLDALSVMISDSVNLGMNGATGSCLITDSSMPGSKYVIMPMRV